MKPLSFQTKTFIHLYERIKFQEEEFLGFDEIKQEADFEEEGYYYFGKSFLLTNYTDLTEEWESNCKIEKIDFDPSLRKEKNFVVEKLIELNKKELEKVKKEIKYWEKKQEKLPKSIPKIQRILKFYSTVILYFNDWFSRYDKSKQIKVKRPQYKKDHTEEIKLYIRIFKKVYPEEFQIKDLVEWSIKFKNPIKYITWWRRLRDKEFLRELWIKIEPKRIRAVDEGNQKDIDLFDQIIKEIAIRDAKVPERPKKDLLDTNKVNRRKDVTEIVDEDDMLREHYNPNIKNASSSYITPSYKLILN